ncbi:MAG: indole-3-glycerol-phosphate synthase [archaeon]|nr:MAG: indole-3-glycerol-phosphate synthase [archaeon]
MQPAPSTFLEELVQSALARVRSGYYSVEGTRTRDRRSLVTALRKEGRVPLVAEVKFTSPAEGVLRKPVEVGSIAKAYERGGAAGISVLTEPDHFDGRLDYLEESAAAVGIPVMMKDVVLDEVQVQAAQRLGADAILLISSAFPGPQGKERLRELVSAGHDNGLEVVVEAHGEDEYRAAFETEADAVGINNRDLDTLRVSLEVSRRLLSLGLSGKPVICESGIRTRAEVDMLRRLGADGFLVGSALMRSQDPEEALRTLSVL